MLSALKRIIQEVNQLPTLHEALDTLVSIVKSEMNVDSCSLHLADYINHQFVLTATNGLEKSAIGKVKISFHEGLIGLIGEREEPINVANAFAHPNFKHFPEVKEESFKAFIGTPIIHQRKVLGVISLQQREERLFDQDDEAFLVTIAAQIALYITSAQMSGKYQQPGEDFNSYQNLNGIPGSPGLAMGYGHVFNFKHELRTLIPSKTNNIQEQISVYRKAVQTTRTQVEQLSANLSDSLPADVKKIFQLYNQLLDANSLGREVESSIRKGWDASSSLKFVIEAYAARFENMDDPYMRERAVDIIDLSNRILSNIMDGSQKQTIPDPQEKFILVADEVSAPMLAEFSDTQLTGIVSLKGSNNSHAAILARAMGVPAVMGLDGVSLPLLQSKELFIDGYSGLVSCTFDDAQRQEYQKLISQEEALFARIDSEADSPPITQDGVSISLLVNAGMSAEVELDQFKQGDGVGLFRTEIPFMMRDRFPSEDEQGKIYRQVLSAHPNKEITMRTLDIGGDKPLTYFPIKEDNPFLGWRGIRLTLDHPDIFLMQVRAMLRASFGLSNLHVLLPMVSTVSEIDDAKKLIKQAFLEVKEEAAEHDYVLSKPAVGVMLEVPSVLFLLPQLAERVDFFSVGTNDLTQYLLAVDRNNSNVASLYSSYHPAVLNALNLIQKEAKKHRVPATVCGELAGEPIGALILIAMGYRRLSMNAHSLHKINWVIRNINYEKVRNMLDDLLCQDSPHEIQKQLAFYLESQGLGGLVRAGK
ncbi:MAG: phosphoenolpyruvate--protein phosphotransferase [Pseudomonadota bacterium]